LHEFAREIAHLHELQPETFRRQAHTQREIGTAALAYTGDDVAQQARAISIRLYEAGRDYARERGIIVADTKFEFGMLDGRLILIDEVLTPDSSRFWPADRYHAGSNPPSFDKQFLRDYLELLDWNKQPPAPDLPIEVIRQTARKYREACERLTGEPVPGQTV